MNAWNRALLTLLAAGATGALLWVGSQFDTHTTGGYWAAMGVIAGGGLLLGLSQLRRGGGSRIAMFMVAFVPVTVAALWAIVVAQPHSNTFRSHLRSWDSDLGITGAVNDIALWNGVLALGIGLVFGLTAEPGLVLRRRRELAPAEQPVPAAAPEPDEVAADEPTAAERREQAATTVAPDGDTDIVRRSRRRRRIRS